MSTITLRLVHDRQHVQPTSAAVGPRAKVLTTEHLREAKKAALASVRVIEAARLDRLMREHEISNEGLAKHLGCNRDIVGKLRRGKLAVPTDKLHAAAERNDGCRKLAIAYVEELLADLKRAA